MLLKMVPHKSLDNLHSLFLRKMTLQVASQMRLGISSSEIVVCKLKETVGRFGFI